MYSLEKLVYPFNGQLWHSLQPLHRIYSKEWNNIPELCLFSYWEMVLHNGAEPWLPHQAKREHTDLQSNTDYNFLVQPWATMHCISEPWFSHLQMRECGIETLWVAFLFPNCMITHYPKRSVYISNCKHYDFTAGLRFTY